MPTCDNGSEVLTAGDVVKVPFPYTDRSTRQHRPALIVSNPDLQRRNGLVWVLMITSAGHRGWDGDIEIADLVGAGLPAPSIIRTAKIATIDGRDAQRLGQLAPATLAAVMQRIHALLGDTAD